MIFADQHNNATNNIVSVTYPITASVWFASLHFQDRNDSHINGANKVYLMRLSFTANSTICVLPQVKINTENIYGWPKECANTQFQDGIFKASTPVTKETYLTSQWMEVGNVAQFDGDFERILS